MVKLDKQPHIQLTCAQPFSNTLHPFYYPLSSNPSYNSTFHEDIGPLF